jgi:dienelactone hydrolase
MRLDVSSIRDLLGGTSAGESTDRGWDRLRGPYHYEVRGRAVIDETQSDGPHRLSRLRLESETGSHHTGLLLRPAGEGACPCVLLLHAMRHDKESMMRLFGRALADRGFASLALDAHLHGERRSGTSERLNPMEYLELAREHVVEYRQALDYLETRTEIDMSRTGLLGYSMGAMMGCVLAGVEERVRACVFMVAGDMVRTNVHYVPVFLRHLAEPYTPSNFVARISPRPVLFINATRDTTVPREAAELLHEAAREPKEIRWVEGGHVLPQEAAARGVEWLMERLGAGA